MFKRKYPVEEEDNKIGTLRIDKLFSKSTGLRLDGTFRETFSYDLKERANRTKIVMVIYHAAWPNGDRDNILLILITKLTL